MQNSYIVLDCTEFNIIADNDGNKVFEQRIDATRLAKKICTGAYKIIDLEQLF